MTTYTAQVSVTSSPDKVEANVGWVLALVDHVLGGYPIETEADVLPSFTADGAVYEVVTTLPVGMDEYKKLILSVAHGAFAPPPQVEDILAVGQVDVKVYLIDNPHQKLVSSQEALDLASED